MLLYLEGMLGVKTGSNNVYRYLGTQFRSFCAKAISNETLFVCSFHEEFSSDEHGKILRTLNESPTEVLSRYKISNGRLKGIADWKKDKGPFKSISEVLEVNGFGEKALKDICTRIVNNNITELKSASPKQYNIKHIMFPQMSPNVALSLKAVVAIHLDPSGIGWAKIRKEDNIVTDWEFLNFSSLPTKMLLPDTFYLALDIVKTLPCGDLYIFEAPPILSFQNQSKHGINTAHHQQAELLSMLSALLNTSHIHNMSLQTITPDQFYSRQLPNIVFYVKHKIPARLFKILIGSEKVSAISAITGIIKGDDSIVSLLPCSPVKFNCNVQTAFINQSPSNQELLAQALMLAISFMDLCVYKNVNSYEALKPVREKKENFQ